MTQPRLRAFQYRDFRIYIAARFCSTMAWQMMSVGVGWHVYQLSHNALDLGLVGLAQFLPFIALVLPAGHVADRFDRRRVLMLAYTVEALCVSALLAIALSGSRNVFLILGSLVLFGAGRAFWAPAGQAMVRNLVPVEVFPSAVAVNSACFEVAVITGPTVGGLLYLAGAGLLFGTVLTLLAVTIIALSVLKPVRSASAPSTGGSHDLLEGLRFVFQHRIVLGSISLDLFAVLFGGATALLPIYASDLLHAGPIGLGALRSAPGVGAGLTAAALAFFPIRHRPGVWMFGGVAVFGLTTIIFGLSRSIPVSLVALFLLGAVDMLSVFVRQTLVQLETPDAIRGRVSAVSSMFIGASNELGEFESGLTARFFGPVGAVVGGGVATLAVVALYLKLFPQLRHLREFSKGH